MPGTHSARPWLCIVSALNLYDRAEVSGTVLLLPAPTEALLASKPGGRYRAPGSAQPVAA